MSPSPAAAPPASGLLRWSARANAAMARFVQWLSQHRTWLAIITTAYFVFIVTFHDVMQQPAYWAQGKLSHHGWNNLVAAVGLPIVGCFGLWMLLSLRGHPRARIAGLYFTLTLILAAVCFRVLTVMNIEAIHYPQYAILGLLLFARTGSFGQTIVWATLCGLVDEGYQYLVLYPDRRIYMDFNDVVLNTLGAGLALVTLFITGARGGAMNGKHANPVPPLHASTAGVAAGGVALFAATAYATGFVRILPGEGSRAWSIVLRRGDPLTEFWTRVSWGRCFHEMHPMEWVLVSVLLMAFYVLLDRFQFSRDSS